MKFNLKFWLYAISAKLKTTLKGVRAKIKLPQIENARRLLLNVKELSNLMVAGWLPGRYTVLWKLKKPKKLS